MSEQCHCGFEAKNARGLAAHQRQKHPDVPTITKEKPRDEPDNYPASPPASPARARCIKCGGWTESDDNELCNMCISFGVDADEVKAQQRGDGWITSTHGITLDMLDRTPEGHYVMPDGSKAPPEEAAQALQNWRDSSVGIVEDM